jgi:hypothetical protein
MIVKVVPLLGPFYPPRGLFRDVTNQPIGSRFCDPVRRPHDDILKCTQKSIDTSALITHEMRMQFVRKGSTRTRT